MDYVAGVRVRASRIRGAVWSGLIRLAGGSVGRDLRIERGARLRWSPHSGISLGDSVYIGVGVIIDCPSGGQLTLGDGVKVMHYSVMGCQDAITIGDHSQIAEHSTIRDQDHDVRSGADMMHSSVTSPVFLGEDVWVGRGCAILRGSIIGHGSVVAANSVVRGEVEPNTIVAGAPARPIRRRAPQ